MPNHCGKGVCKDLPLVFRVWFIASKLKALEGRTVAQPFLSPKTVCASEHFATTETSVIIHQRVLLPIAKPAPLAQLDRASGYEPEGREFESLRAHHSFQALAEKFPISVLGPLGPTVKESPALLAARRRYSSS